MSRRRGVTMVELLVASLMMAGVLVVTYGLLEQGFSQGVEAVDREVADTRGRNALDRYAVMDDARVEAALSGDQKVEVRDLEDAFLKGVDPPEHPRFRRGAHKLYLRAERIPGEEGALALKVDEAWEARGKTKTSGQARLLFPGSGPGPSPSGFTKRNRVPDWGKAGAWAAPDPDEPAASGADPDSVALRALVGVAAAGAGYDPIYEDPPAASGGASEPEGKASGGGTPGFWGTETLPLEAAGVVGPGGSLAAPEGDAPARSAAAAARRLEALLTRAGLTSIDGPADQAVPAGKYQHRLEAVDLRDPKGEGKVAGVFLLRKGGAERPLPYRMLVGKAVRRELGGDEVLERRALQDGRGRPWVLLRTAERLVVAELGRGRPRGDLELKALATADPSPKGTEATRKAADALVTAWKLKAASGEGVDALLVASAGRSDELEVALEGGEPPPGKAALLPERALSEVEKDMVAPLKATDLNPGAKVAWKRARQLAVKDPQQALKPLDGFLRTNPGFREARALRGRVLAALGRLEEAIADLEVAAGYWRPPPGLLVDLAGLCLRAGRLDTAEAVIRRLRWESRDAAELKQLQTALEALKLDPKAQVPYRSGKAPGLRNAGAQVGVVLVWGGAG